MKCYFPNPSLSNNYSRIINAPPIHKTHQADTINQLRLQNQLLKQQLSSLINNKNQQPTEVKEIHFQNNFIPKVALNSELEVQEKYRNKMLKLKSGRSRSRNGNHYDTAPSSPRKQEFRQENNVPQRMPFVPLPLRNQQNLKVMIVQKDSNGRFYRDRQSEQKVQTVRMSSPQTYPFKKDFYSPKSIQNQNFPPQFVPQHKGHRRSETVPIQEQNAELTKRINSRYSTVETNQNLCEFSRQFIDSRRQTFQENNAKPSFRRVPSHNQLKLDFNAKCAESIQVIKPNIISPRRAAYTEQESTQNMKKITAQNENKCDSLLSIDKGITETKTKRKLRYDIYLEDDKAC